MKQQNIDLVLRFYEEVFNAHDISKLDELNIACTKVEEETAE